MSAAWGALTDDEIAELLDNIKDDSFLLEYPDAKEGKRMTIKVYVSSRTAPMYNYTKNDGEIRDRWMWQGLSVSFTEV